GVDEGGLNEVHLVVHRGDVSTAVGDVNVHVWHRVQVAGERTELPAHELDRAAVDFCCLDLVGAVDDRAEHVTAAARADDEDLGILTDVISELQHVVPQVLDFARVAAVPQDRRNYRRVDVEPLEVGFEALNREAGDRIPALELDVAFL